MSPTKAPTGESLSPPTKLGNEQPGQQLIHEYGLGVDCHSRFFQVALFINRGREMVFREWRVDANWVDLGRAKLAVLSTLEGLGVIEDPSKLRYVCESTGQYHMPLVLSWRGRPSVINPADTGHARRKTDKLDAKKLAHHSLTGLWRESWIAPPDVQELRVLTVQRARLVSERSRVSNRINGDMLRFGHTVGQLGRMNGKIVRPLVEDYCAHGAVKLFGEHFTGERIPYGVRVVIGDRWKRIDALTEEVKAVEKLTRELVDKRSWQIRGGELVEGRRLREVLQTVPGVGEWTVLVWLAEIGDVTRFPGVNQVCAYAGFDASLGVSAGKVTHNFTRKGNARLYGALKNAARAAVTATGARSNLVGWVLRYMARQTKAAKARGTNALGRRLCRAMYFVHWKCEVFNDAHYMPVLNESSYPVCGVDEMGLPPRVVEILKTNGLFTSRQVVEAFFTNLSRTPGCGPRTVQTVGEWINAQSLKKPGPHRTGEPPSSQPATPSGDSQVGCDSEG